jgi:hypothetical protein
MVKLREAVAVYAGAFSEHQLLVSGIKWSTLTAVQLLDHYSAAEAVRLAHEADSMRGEFCYRWKVLEYDVYPLQPLQSAMSVDVSWSQQLLCNIVSRYSAHKAAVASWTLC